MIMMMMMMKINNDRCGETPGDDNDDDNGLVPGDEAMASQVAPNLFSSESKSTKCTASIGLRNRAAVMATKCGSVP